MRSTLTLFICCLLGFPVSVIAQDIVLKKDSTVTRAAGPQFKASGWKQIWWGKHYRSDWQEPVSFPVIDLDASAGGLTPTKLGGGHQSKSLRLLGANGKEYILRTIDKNLDLLIPELFRDSYIHDIINDQISTAHPYGPIAVAALAESIGIYHTNPVIVVVPSSGRLGEFESTFAGKLCVFEERPSGKGWEKTPLTGNADDVINAETLIKKIRDDNDRSVDQKALLKVRLFDMIINDWDRHEDQWVWLAHKKDDKTVYTAFARDRDQSFSKTDGINLYFLSRPWLLQSVQNLDPKIKNVIGTSLAARYMDKNYLNKLSREDWTEVIQSLQQSLTDEAIRAAVNRMPANIVKISGEYVASRLIARRNDMMRFGLKYYEILNKEVDVAGTDKKELFHIQRLSSDELRLTVQKFKNDQPGDTLYDRIFKNKETNKLYLYGLGEDDAFQVSGEAANRMKVTVNGGEGKDKYLATSGKAGRRIRIFDEKNNQVSTPAAYKARFTNDTSLTNYNRKRFEYDWYMPQFLPGYNPDDGFFLGAKFTYRKKAWGKKPYAWQQSLGAQAAFKTGATHFFYNGRFTRAIGKWDLFIDGDYRGPQYVFNFYGYGNETKFQTDDRSYNRVRVKQLLFQTGVVRTFGKHELRFGPVFEQLRVEANDNKFISSGFAGVDARVFTNNSFLGGDLQYRYEKKNNNAYPSKGLIFHTGLGYKANITGGKKDFTSIRYALTFYLPVGPLVLAHRTGGAANIGDFEFYHANTLGSSDNLRGYYRSRFTGKSSFYQNTELRWALAKINGYVFRGKMGIFGFFDDGRVWLENDNSNKFHSAYGGGLFFLPYNAAALNLSYGISEESKILKFGLSFFL